MIVSPGGPQTVGNSSAPQLADYGKALGYGLVLACCLKSTNAGFSQEYHHGTHQVAVYESQFKGKIFASVKGGVPNDAVRSFIAAPQQYDFTLPAQLFQPTVNQQAGAIGSQYTFGLHAQQIADSQNRSVIFPSAATPPGSTSNRPLSAIIVPPQAFDYTLPAWSKIPSVTTGWISTQIGAGPQLVDLTLAAQVSIARPKPLILAPWNPTTIISKSQDDPTQLPAKIFSPPTIKATSLPIRGFFASQADPSQLAARVFPSVATPPKPSHVVQPAILLIQEQAYQNVYQQIVSMPVIGGAGPPPPPDGFRVTAVTAGWYQNVFRTPGDVFDIKFAAEFSDSTIDYQINSNGIGFGWMAKVAPNTPLVNWLDDNNVPYLPPQDPSRRFIY